MPELEEGPCTAVLGNELVSVGGGQKAFAHDVAKVEMGACPWCGEEEE